jgi:hypothetical protein
MKAVITGVQCVALILMVVVAIVTSSGFVEGRPLPGAKEHSKPPTVKIAPVAAPTTHPKIAPVAAPTPKPHPKVVPSPPPPSPVLYSPPPPPLGGGGY